MNLLKQLLFKNILKEVKPSIYVFEVGARGLIPEFGILNKYINYVGFEPDLESCIDKNKLISRSGCFNSAKAYDYALMNKVNLGDYRFLNLCIHQGCSSMLEPNFTQIEKFSGHRIKDLYPWSRHYQVIKKLPVPVIQLNHFCEKYSYNQIDILKLDTQGTELEIIESGIDIISKTTIAIEVETELIEIYKNQPLFEELNSRINGLEFDLIRIDNMQMLSRNINGLINYFESGELASFDALYIRNIENNYKELSPEYILKYMLILLHYGLISKAHYTGDCYIKATCTDNKAIKILLDNISLYYKLKNFHKINFFIFNLKNAIK